MEKSRLKKSGAHAAPTLFLTAAGRWQLHRYPLRSNDPLQAWDAADELLHEALISHDSAGGSTAFPLLVNDACGALLMAVTDRQVTSHSDSYISHLAQKANLALNQLSCDLRQVDPLAALPPDIDVILMKLPKNQSLLAFQLAQMSASLRPGTPLLIAAKSKLFTPGVRELFAQYCDAVDISLVQKSAVYYGQKFVPAP